MKNAKLIKLINSCGLTDFQKRVLLATLSIKRGQVRACKQIAAQSREQECIQGCQEPH